ncbi:MAG: hypothetical protein QOE70_3128 [Chthoniobacter sp.]|jgi:hypothetical protein|nr:hypothetical protein [Chthoniobacter sp.]
MKTRFASPILPLLCAVTAIGAAADITYPPALPGGKEVVTETSEEFLKAPPSMPRGITIAKAAPTIDLLFFPDQDYAGRPWSAWGDSLAVGGNYYASIGDHLAPGGNAFVFEYDPETRKMRQLVNLRKLLALPEGDYTPGKIHSRLDAGDDGWIYFSTHRGSTRVTTDEFHYTGDWIIRCHPASGKAEIVARGPVPKHCIPCSVLDPKRLIFYGGTAPGTGKDGEDIQFFAYDVRAQKILYSGPGGPARYMIFAKSTGRVYFTPGKEGEGALMRYDPERGGAPEKIDGTIGLRTATQETPDGFVYTVSSGQGGAQAMIQAFNTRTEQVEDLGPAAVGTEQYITSIDADPTGRFLYYVPGAHGGSERDGSPVVQFDVKTRKKKVIAFLHPFFAEKYGCTLKGTFSSAVDPAGDKLFITWNNSRGSRVWDSCVLTVIHIPESERKP